MGAAENTPTVLGYHGTTLEGAKQIFANGFRLSRNEWDWLGDGVYFFQDSPQRALEWAREHHGDNAGVVGAEIRLVDCFDLQDPRWTRLYSGLYDQYTKYLKDANLPRPKQTSGAHRLDRDVINYSRGVLAEQGINIACVRCAFNEGSPVYPDSAIYDRSHVQIAVLDVNLCIKRTWLEFPGGHGDGG